MAVVIETTAGDITVDLYVEARPAACLNFLKLCKLKYYNYNLFHTIQHGFIAQTGDPTGVGDGGKSVWGLMEGQKKQYFEAEYIPKKRHSEPGLLSMVSFGRSLIGSQFFITLGSDLTSLDGIHCIFGQVSEGFDVLRKLNEAICDSNHRPYQDIRITHTVILEDPFDNPRGFRVPRRSPSPSAERLRGGRIGADEEIDDTTGKTEQEIHEMMEEREAKARATILEIVGDLPDADVAPPENVLFVCKLNSVTTDDDLEIIFSRFGKVIGCEVIRDRVTGDSLQYAFVEFEDRKACEAAYFKMDNVLIDDRRIHVDFSQSVSKVQWRGKGRGLVIKDGSKNNRIDFSNYKESGNQNKSSRRDRRPENQGGRFRRNSPRPHPRGNQRRSRSRSPRRYNRDNRRSPCRENRDNRTQRSRSRSLRRDNRDNRDSTRQQRPGRNVSRSRDRNEGRSNEKAHCSSTNRRSVDSTDNDDKKKEPLDSKSKKKSKKHRSSSSSSLEARKKSKKSKKSKKNKYDSSESDSEKKHKKNKKKKDKKSKKPKRKSSSSDRNDSDSDSDSHSDSDSSSPKQVFLFKRNK